MLKISRRSFIGIGLGLAAGLGFIRPKALLSAQAGFELGSYTGHIAYNLPNEEIVDNPVDGLYRFVHFPIESKVEIRFQSGYETYTGFNASDDTIRNINAMDEEVLIKHMVPDLHLQDTKMLVVDGIQFRLASITRET